LNRFACAALVLCLILAAAAGAQDRAQEQARDKAHQQAIDDLKGKIFDARMAQRTFERGLKYCGELDGKHFYFLPRDRVLDLEEFHRSLESLAKQQVFNPEKHRPWTDQDAAERWEQAQKQAASDQANCALAASLPVLEKQLEALEAKPSAPEKKN
jgi:hypothetical protein